MNKEKNIKFKPCPRCGWKPRVAIGTEKGRNVYSVGCSNSKCTVDTASFMNKEYAIEAWNSWNGAKGIVVCKFEKLIEFIETFFGIEFFEKQKKDFLNRLSKRLW